MTCPLPTMQCLNSDGILNDHSAYLDPRVHFLCIFMCVCVSRWPNVCFCKSSRDSLFRGLSILQPCSFTSLLLLGLCWCSCCLGLSLCFGLWLGESLGLGFILGLDQGHCLRRSHELWKATVCMLFHGSTAAGASSECTPCLFDSLVLSLRGTGHWRLLSSGGHC